MTAPITKACTKCEHALPATAFRARWDGQPTLVCASCLDKNRDQKRRVRARDPEAWRAKDRAYVLLNREKARAANRRWNKRHALVMRAKRLSDWYGLSLEECDRMRDAQGGRCAICRRVGGGGREQLQVDHCHSTGRVRGLLCRACNAGLGQFRDNVDDLRAGIAYLVAHASAEVSA